MKRTSVLLAFALLTLTAIFAALNSPQRARAQPVPTSLPTTVVVATTVPTTVATTTSIPAYATSVPTTAPTTTATTYPTTKPTVIPGTPPPTPTVVPSAPPTSAPGASVRGCPLFPASDWVYGTRVDGVAADPNSDAYMQSYLSYVGQSATLSLSYSNSFWFVVPANASTPQYPLVQPQPSGTPAPAGKPPIADFPFTADMPWQGKGVAYTGDRHILVLDASTCIEYESYVSGTEPPPTWNVVNNQLQQASYYGGRWNLAQPYPSPSPRTGVNLAGVPQFAGMVHWEEWLRGDIPHALNINVKSHGMGGAVYPCNASIPLSYFNGTVTPPIPCGVHWRLKSSYVLNCSPACPQAQLIVTALKRYGAFMMDQGTPPGTLYLANEQQSDGTWIVPWDQNDVRNIQSIPMSALEVVPPPGCASVAACVKTTNAPYGLTPGICPILPQWWKREHRVLYRRLCEPSKNRKH